MTAKRNRRKPSSSKTTKGDHAPKLSQSLASALLSSQGHKKSLYCLLVKLSLSEAVGRADCNSGLHHMAVEYDGKNVELSLENICFLSEFLFKELDMRFNDFFSAIRGQIYEPSISCPNMPTTEEITLLLRCCMTVLGLLISRQDLVIEKAQTLLSVLDRLLSLDLKEVVKDNFVVFTNVLSREYKGTDDCQGNSAAKHLVSSVSVSERSDLHRIIFFAALEVFADELLMNKAVRECVTVVDHASFSSKKLFRCSAGHYGLGCVLEVISGHFIFSLSDEKACRSFLDRLYWQDAHEFTTPQISLCAALFLLLNPVMFSAPRTFHAYFLSLVSDTIGIDPTHNKILDVKLFDYHLAAFERSVILYTKQTCNLHKGKDVLSSGDLLAKSSMKESNEQVDFESLLSPLTYAKISSLASRISDSWGSYFSNTSSEENTELLASSISYVREILPIFERSCSGETLSEILAILSSILLRSCCDDAPDAVLELDKKTNAQDLYFLASILKLMSCSMLRVLWFLNNAKNSSECSGYGSPCRGYEIMMRISEIFQKFSVTLPVQDFICKEMEPHSDRHAKSKWLLLHFSGLLSLSFAARLNFLVKDCIFAIITTLYLFIFEEGDLQALGSLTGPSSKSPFGSSSSIQASKNSDIVEEAVGNQQSSKAVALKFQKIRTLYFGTGLQSRLDETKDTGVSKNSRSDHCTASAVSIREETCNGESFLHSVMARGSLELSDIDDLADFIECKSGKDYSDWLKGREIFRRRRSEKLAICRWNKKKKAWRDIKGKQNVSGRC